MKINRREMLTGAGTIGAGTISAATLSACSSREPGAQVPTDAQLDKHGNPRIPAELNTHTKHIITAKDLSTAQFPGGNIFQANENNFPILAGQDASVAFINVAPSGVREPHWHPSAWEINVITSGTAHWTVVEPGGYTDTFMAKAGDVVFMPQGSMHYFRNASQTEWLHCIVIFNVATDEAKTISV